MSDFGEIRIYILFFEQNDLKYNENGSIKIEPPDDLYSKRKENNYLFYKIIKSQNGYFCIKKLDDERNITFAEFIEKLKEEAKFKTALGFGLKLSSLKDSHFLGYNELKNFKKDITERNESNDIWMNLIIVNPIALFLTENIKFANANFINANTNIKPKVFLLKYPRDYCPNNDIEKLIMDKQLELEPYPFFYRYTYRQIEHFIEDYANRVYEVAEKNRAFLFKNRLEN